MTGPLNFNLRWLTGHSELRLLLNQQAMTRVTVLTLPGPGEMEQLLNDWAENNTDGPYLRYGFLDSSIGKESSCNAGDLGSIPGLGRSAGEGTDYPLQYSWASLVAQMVKNLPTTWETWVRSLGWEDALEKGKATHSSILA